LFSDLVFAKILGPITSGDSMSGKNTQSSLQENRLFSPSAELHDWVAKQIGPIVKPDDMRFSGSLPKTRSRKIMRRILARKSRRIPPRWRTKLSFYNCNARADTGQLDAICAQPATSPADSTTNTSLVMGAFVWPATQINA